MSALDYDRDVVAPIVAMVPPASMTSVAFHEAGHVVIALSLGVRIDVVSIRPGEAHLGVALHGRVGGFEDFDLGPWWQHPRSVRTAGSCIAIALAGIAAERLAPSTEAYGQWDRDAGERATAAVARLSPAHARSLTASEADASGPDDGTTAWSLALALTGSVAEAAAHLGLMRASTRRLVDDRSHAIAAVARALTTTPVLDGAAVEGIITKETSR